MINRRSFRLLINFASRSRPEKYRACLENIRATTTCDYTVLPKLDRDDPRLHDYPDDPTPVLGMSMSKMHAINRGIPSEGWEILVNTSDDMWFSPGWSDQVRDDMSEDLDCLLHYPDGNTSEIVTLAIMGHRYYHRFDYVYHQDYKSLWADNEQTDVARTMRKLKFVDKQIFEHRHPAFGKAPVDDQYRRTESYYHEDHATFLRRKYEADRGTQVYYERCHASMKNA